jgi:hypothetical protein
MEIPPVLEQKRGEPGKRLANRWRSNNVNKKDHADREQEIR